MRVVKKGFESVLQLRCTVYIMKETFYCAIRKIMSSNVNDQSIYSVQNECPLICKDTSAENLLYIRKTSEKIETRDGVV